MEFRRVLVRSIGGGSDLDVKFSEPLPIDWWGIEKPDGSGSFISKDGFPALSAGQRYTFNVGQYSGLESSIGKGLNSKVSYKYRNPQGVHRRDRKSVVQGKSVLVMVEYGS